MADPRPSTDEENAPLLTGQTHDDNDPPVVRIRRGRKIFGYDTGMTDREMVLGALAIAFLITASTFIGLYAASKVALNKERKHHHDEHPGHEDALTSHARTADGIQKVCTSADCVLAASSLIQGMNTSADPCEDFYEFANGGWLDDHAIPADRGLLGSFTLVQDNNKKILTKIIDNIPDSSKKSDSLDAEHDNLRKLKDTYNSCMNTDLLNELGDKPFRPLAKHVLSTIGDYNVPLNDDKEEFAAPSYLGTWSESYEIPQSLRAIAAKNVEIQNKLRSARRPSVSSAPKLQEALTDASVSDKKRAEKITDVLAFLGARDVDVLFNFVIEGDAGGDNSQIQSLWFYQSFGGLPAKEYYKEPEILDLYTGVVADILTAVADDGKKKKRDFLTELAEEAFETVEEGAETWPWPWPGSDGEPKPEQPFDSKKLATKVVEFEKKIVEAGAELEYLFNPHYAYNPYPASKVDDALPFFNLGEFLAAMNPRTRPEKITVTYPPYLKSINKLVDEVSDPVLSAYFITKLALQWYSALGPRTPLFQAGHRLSNFLKGVKPDVIQDRQDVCLSAIDIVGFIAGREFVHAAFSAEAKQDGEAIIQNIVNEFHDALPHISWMDEKSAKAAQAKASSLIPKVGYPLYPNTTDPASLARWYGRVDIRADAYFDNNVQATLANNERTWSTLGRERNRDSWEMYPQTVNAYYSPPDGEIVFPAGILQPPFYSYSWPTNLKYGAFGAVAAHELTHAFDNSGAQYDDKGRLRDWWTKSTVEKFQEKAQCIAKQYSQYYVLDDKGNKVHVNGNLTNGEDIGDSGLKQAYNAWKREVGHGKDKAKETAKLPGLDYDAEQVFFIAFARIWAQLTRPATAVARVRTDPHSPPYWRATGTLRNLDAFHEAFKCKKGSKMNPDKQCKLW